MPPKTGVDDYLAAGGTVAELKLMARPYKREDLAGVRMSRDEQLRNARAELLAAWEGMRTVKRGECTDRSIARELIRRVERAGKVSADGIRVVASIRTLALAVGVSTRGALNSLRRLQESGFLRPDNEGRARDKPGAYVLLTGRALGKQYGKGRGHEEEQGESRERGNTLSVGPYDRRVYLARAPSEDVPELRWPTVLVRREFDKRGRPRKVYEYLGRLGKKRQAVLEFLLEAGGVATVEQLIERFAGTRTRPRDFKRRTLAMLAELPAIVLIEGDTVSLTPRWREALEKARQLAGEHEAARLQAQRYARQREAFRHRHEAAPDPVPEMRSIPDMRKPWPVHPEGCVCPACVERFGAPEGEHPDDCKCAPCFSARKDEERDRAHKEGRRVVPIAPHRRRSPRPPRPVEEAGDRPADDWRSHPLDCECLDCAAQPPTYAPAARAMT